jgi:hypothetical protein
MNEEAIARAGLQSQKKKTGAELSFIGIRVQVA